MKLHQKGFLLVTLGRQGTAWDHVLVTAALEEYGVGGRRWVNTLRIALDELASGGLIERLEARLGDGADVQAGRVSFRYGLTDFGRQRMTDTSLEIT